MGERTDNALCFVQFMHPGGEHQPDDGCFKSWNRDKHKRKFMVSRGRYVRRGSRRATGDRWEEKAGELAFWGEWEPQSEVICRIARPKARGPRFLYRPFYLVPTLYDCLQNTDPFVFGGFFYGNCMQHRKGRPTQLCHLENGSVVLFGSHASGNFILDTVFVVRGSVRYDRASSRSKLRPCIPDYPTYKHVVLKPLFQSACGHREGCSPDNAGPYRLYIGATYDKPTDDGMFSFFPCIPRRECCVGFERPVIDLPGLTNGGLRQGFRLNRQVDHATVANTWHSVVDQVLGIGLRLGTEARVPEGRRRYR